MSNRKKKSGPAGQDEKIVLTDDPLDGMVSDDVSELEYMADEQEHLFESSAHQLAKCFVEIRNRLGPYEARALLEELLKSPLSEVPKRDRHRLSDRERKLMADSAAAPTGSKKIVISDDADDNKKGKQIKADSSKRALARARKKDVGYLFSRHVEKSRKG